MSEDEAKNTKKDEEKHATDEAPPPGEESKSMSQDDPKAVKNEAAKDAPPEEESKRMSEDDLNAVKTEAKDATDEAPQPEVENKRMSEDDLKAVEQVKDRLKFFFSDANVRQDFFVRKFLMSDKGDHPRKLTIESLLRFNTIKKHTTKKSVIVQAAKELSELLTLDEKETAIGRVIPFTESMMDDNVPKSLFLKNLPLKYDDDKPKQYAVTVEEIREKFEKYGEVALVQLRWSSNPEGMGDDDIIGGDKNKRQKKKKYPVGCAMVEFFTEGSLEKAAEETLTTKNGEKLDAKEKISFDDENKEAEVMLLSEYKEARKKERAEENRNGDKKKRNRKEEEEEEEEAEPPPFELDWKPGCVIKMNGLSPETCDREAMLEMVAEALDVTVSEVKGRKIYVDYSRGQTDGAIRFPEPADHIVDIAKRLKEGGLEIRGCKVSEALVLEGDEEKKYWDDFIEFKNKQRRQREGEKRSRKKRRR